MLLTADAWERAAQIAGVVEGVGALAAVVAIYFLVQQTRALGDQTKALREAEERSADVTAANAYANVGSLTLHADAIFADYPDLRAYAYGEVKLPPPRTPERNRAWLAAEIFFDIMDVYSQQEHLLQQGAAGTWRTFASDVYRDSETIRAFWGERRLWYPLELREVLDDIEDACSLRDNESNQRPPHRLSSDGKDL